MGFFEFLAMFTAVTAIFVGLPWALFTGIARVKAAGAGDGTELRVSELQGLIDEAVAEATAPLVARIETLEAIVTDDEPTARPRLANALDALPDDEDLGAKPVDAGRRTRA
jgi:hypothetical protein